MHSTLDKEIDNAKAIGHGLISVFTVAILLAIVAVVLANGSATASLITQFFKLLSWLVAIIVNPVSGGSQTDVDNTSLVPAESVRVAANDGTGSSGMTTGTGGTTQSWNVIGADGQWKGITTDPTLIKPGETLTPAN